MNSLGYLHLHFVQGAITIYRLNQDLVTAISINLMGHNLSLLFLLPRDELTITVHQIY